MTKKNILMAVMAVVLAAVYVIYFTDWFRPKTVQIFHTYRNLRPHAVRPGNGALPGLIFGVNHEVKLTELRVVEDAVYQTNQDALPLWHLISDSNSVPVKQFHYGQVIAGLHASVKGAHPQLLETNVTYRLILVAGKIKGEHSFEVK